MLAQEYKSFDEGDFPAAGLRIFERCVDRREAGYCKCFFIASSSLDLIPPALAGLRGVFIVVQETKQVTHICRTSHLLEGSFR